MSKDSATDNLLAELQAWLASRHADYRQWDDEDFGCMQFSPDIVVAIDCLSFFEWRNTDGGLDQVFAETHPHWRQFLKLCKQGYSVIGAKEKALGIDEVHELFANWEPSFQLAWKTDFESLDPSSPETPNLKRWRSEKFENFPHRTIQSKFYYSDGVEQLRTEWLGNNERELRAIMALADLNRFESQLARMKDAGLNLGESTYAQTKQRMSQLAEKLM